jgi:hypothetical protein
VGWSSGTANLIQRYDSSGAKVGGETLAPASGSIAVLTNGEVAVACCGAESISPGQTVTVSRYSAAGVLLSQDVAASEPLVFGPRGGFFRDIQVVALADGGFVVSMVRIGSTSVGILNTVLTKRYDSQGQPVGILVTITQVNAAGAVLSHSLAADAEGGYTVTVTQPKEVAPFNPLTSLFHIDANGALVQIVDRTAANAMLLPLAGNRFVLFTSDAAGSFRQLLNSAGNPVGDRIPIAAMPLDAKELADGSYVVFSLVNSRVMVQRFDANGGALGDAVPVDASVVVAPGIALASGGFALAWTANEVFTQRVWVRN